MIRTMGHLRGRKLGSLAVLLLASLAMSACGSSSSSSKAKPSTQPSTQPVTQPQPSGQVSKAKYVAEADAICRAGPIRLRPLNAKAKTQAKVRDTAGLAQTLDQAATIAEQTLAKLRALPPPIDNTLAQQYFNGVQAQIGLIRQFSTAVKQNNANAVAPLTQQINRGSVTVRTLARRYGFKVCAGASA